jgi:uncharacterized protein YycO
MGLNWKYKNEDFTEELIGDSYGFVYQITNLLTGRKYIGKKLFYFSKTKQVKGKKKKIKVPSDWKTYYGSSDELLKDVTASGEINFGREILHLCKTKGECSYLEAREQFDHRVMESDDYYNSWIMVRVRKTHIKSFIEDSKNVRLSTTV